MKNFLVFINALLLLIFVNFTDILFDFEESIFYLLPITYLSWNLKNNKLNIIFTFISAITWISTEIFTGNNKNINNIHSFWNFIITLFFFYIISYLTCKVKVLLEKEIELARIDFLTNLYNKRALKEQIDIQIDKMKLSESFFSIAFIDLDGFKKVNDEHGHTKGDFVLIEIAKIIKNNLENHDFVSRIGGDEFIIVFFDPEIDHIKEKLEKIKDNIEENMIKLDLDVTASIGLVTYNKEPENFDAIIKFSDEKMYEAKKAGKNVIVCDFF